MLVVLGIICILQMILNGGSEEGVMARNCYIDGYYLSANGAMLSPEAA